jgi:uncharacterized membrane protein YgaE (UPF0421/DUF939 family)
MPEDGPRATRSVGLGSVAGVVRVQAATRLAMAGFTARDALSQGMNAAVVAVFCYSTARIVPGLPEAYWAPIAAVVVLYPDLAATRRAAMQRFLGTVLGSLIGWAGAAWWNQNVLVYGLAIWVAVGACCALRLEAAARLCAVSVSVITLIPRPEAAHWAAFHRFIEVSYGVACATGYTLLMDRAARRRRQGISS